MYAIIYTAISRILEEKLKDASMKLRPGKFTVDRKFIVTVKGTVSKGEDTSYTPTADIPLKLALALFVEKSGVVGEHALKMLEESMTEALKWNEDKETKADLIADKLKNVEKATAAVKAMLAKLPKKSKSGITKVDADVEFEELIEA